ncbi:MAG: YggT family protein [bacterium]|nr:YggT family protein [bacterium]
MEILFDAYCFILFLRFIIPFTGQMYFNPAFGFLVKITDPVIGFVRNMLFGRLSDLLPLFAMVLIFTLKILWLIAEVKTMAPGALRLSAADAVEKGFFGAVSFFFAVYFIAAAFYCIESFRNAYDNISRILKDLIQPISRFWGLYLGRDSAKAAAVFLSVIFIFFVLKLLILNGFLSYRTGKFIFSVAALYAASVSMLADIVKILKFYTALIFIRIIISWFAVSYRGLLSAFFFNITEPYLSVFRRFRLFAGPIDFSPMIAIFAIWFTAEILQRIIIIMSGLV